MSNLRIINAEKLAEELKNGVEWLYSIKAGCCHWNLQTDDNDRRWSIVVGWSDGFEENEEGFYSDGSFQICSKIGWQDWTNAMQSDFDIDFEMPILDDSGEVFDTCSAIPKNSDWLVLAEELLKQFDEVVKQCAYFYEEDEEVA